jgi:ferrous iron transport protein A
MMQKLAPAGKSGGSEVLFKITTYHAIPALYIYCTIYFPGVINMTYKTLDNILPGESARVVKLGSREGIRRRLQDIGLIEDTRVECVGQSPSGNPLAFLIRGAVIALRRDDCADILVRV